MGSQYTSQTQSGYNVGAPPDDGSTTSVNLMTWAGVKTKLADPAITLAQAINTAALAALDFNGRSVSANDTATAADHMRTIECTAALTETLPTASVIGAGFTVNINNTSTSSVTVALQTNTDTLEGTANGTFTVPAGNSYTFKVNVGATGYNIVSSYFTTITNAVNVTGTVASGATGTTQALGTANTTIATTAFVNPGASLTANGYRKNADGSIEQWGHATPTSTGVIITFPIPFPTAAFNLVATVQAGVGAYTTFQSLGASSVFIQEWAPGGIQTGGYPVYWRAVGY